MIQESASSLVQTVITFSVRILLSFEITMPLHVINSARLSLSWSFRNFWTKWPLRFVLFVTLVRKLVSKFAGNGVELLSGNTGSSEHTYHYIQLCFFHCWALPIYLTWIDLLELIFSTQKHELRTGFEKLLCLRGALRVWNQVLPRGCFRIHWWSATAHNFI